MRERYRQLIFLSYFVLLLVMLFYSLHVLKASSENDKNIIMMESFRQKDAPLVDEILNLESNNFTETEAMYKFYHLISFPLQGVCRVLKRVGGQWLDWASLTAEAVDGDKFVCMDKMLLDSDRPCLIYSFGIANDWTFEDFMDYRGCEIHAHDPTVEFPADRGQNIRFSKLGLAKEVAPNMDTLVNILWKNGHTDILVDYLKIDIEGAEIGGLPDWLATGALTNVHQIALELHLTPLHEGPHFNWLLDVLQHLYKLNFRLISHEVNMVVGPHNHKLYNLMEVVFMKDDIWNV